MCAIETITCERKYDNLLFDLNQFANYNQGNILQIFFIESGRISSNESRSKGSTNQYLISETGFTI